MVERASPALADSGLDGPPPKSTGDQANGASETPADLLAAAADSSTLEPQRRIFVNRNLRFDQIRQIGFDMDYTLAPYQKRQIEQLSFTMTAEKLVHKLGYPRAILDIPYDPTFVVRGLVVDKKRGNIFKMDSHNHVGRVYHGRRELSKEERRELYRNVKIRLSAPKYHWIDTLFALPEAALYADVIDLFELKLGMTRVPYWKLFDDIRAMIDECHRDGSLKSIVKAELARYIVADPLLPQTLHKLRSAGKRLFVLTNSLFDYTDAVMSFILDGKLAEYPSWRKFFDLIIVGAAKPVFFTGDAPFLKIDHATGAVAAADGAVKFERHAIYQGGSLGRFEELLGERGEAILYVGDHIYGDIIRSKKDSLWRTALILEDLEDELVMMRSIHHTQSDLIAIEEHRATLDHETMTLKLRIAALERAIDDRIPPEEEEELQRARKQLRMMLDRKRRDLRAVIERRDELSSEVERSYNPYWGSVFKEAGNNSRFGEQVEDYACIYTSRVSNFLAYSPRQYFRAPRHWMPHEKI